MLMCVVCGAKFVEEDLFEYNNIKRCPNCGRIRTYIKTWDKKDE